MLGKARPNLQELRDEAALSAFNGIIAGISHPNMAIIINDAAKKKGVSPEVMIARMSWEYANAFVAERDWEEGGE